jgi:Aspartyl/asparaginyl-tRNA synthetases
MKEVFARDLLHQAVVATNEPVFLTGWVKTIRRGAHFSFLELNDGTDLRHIQIVLGEKMPNYQAVTN